MDLQQVRTWELRVCAFAILWLWNHLGLVQCWNFLPLSLYLICDFALQVSQVLEDGSDAPSHGDIPASLYIQGLANPEHSCFFNAVVQLLASSALLNSKRSLEELESNQKLGPCLAEAISSVNRFTMDDQPQSAAPLLQHLAQKNPAMNGHVQQDSHEALMLLLDLVQQEMEAKEQARLDPDQLGMLLQLTFGKLACIMLFLLSHWKEGITYVMVVAAFNQVIEAPQVRLSRFRGFLVPSAQ
jgi:hypothetical protein